MPNSPRADAPTHRFRTKLIATLGTIALLVVGAVISPLGGKIADLIWPAAEAELPGAVVAGEPCRSGGPAASISLSYAFRPSMWWATPAKLPTEVIDELNRADNSEATDATLAPFTPVQSMGKAGTSLKVAVTGCGPRPVVITNLRPVVSKRDKPFGGSLVFVRSQGETEVVEIGFDLDARDPAALAYDTTTAKLGGAYFDSKVVNVAPQETVPLRLMGITKTSYVEWVLAFDTLVDGKAWKFLVALPGGAPIRSTALLPSYQSLYSLDFSAQPRPLFKPVSPASLLPELRVP
ncbi:hypothetical protein F4553_000917 [Allocatelliglobosispora scoriae]|uniref:Uncharacterized protein n=1 Tax=Allocatelliglobosispora scoriae TaxID=643052 RepID=A0A841BJM8_9ACTN|nr:hypothetical protein [Allocatelliglobosispora scoriae]MBB5867538.1 hypothetical protein [Allocatelliglobosispora scoriae]